MRIKTERCFLDIEKFLTFHKNYYGNTIFDQCKRKKESHCSSYQDVWKNDRGHGRYGGFIAVLQRKNSRASPFSEALERIKKYREKNLNTESR